MLLKADSLSPTQTSLPCPLLLVTPIALSSNSTQIRKPSLQQHHLFLQAKGVQRTRDSCLSPISMAKPQRPFRLIMHKVKQRLTVYDQSKLAIFSVIYIHTQDVFIFTSL